MRTLLRSSARATRSSEITLWSGEHVRDADSVQNNYDKVHHYNTPITRKSSCYTAEKANDGDIM